MRLTKRGCAVVVLTAVLAIALVLVVGGWLLLRSLGLAGSGDPGRRVAISIPEGASAGVIGELLERRGVIRSAFGFRLATLIEDGAEDIQAGRYRLRRGLTARAALAALGEGPELEFVTVTFPEGSWLTDFARIVAETTDIDRDRFLRLARSGGVASDLRPPGTQTLEGLLWPSTYQVDEHTTAASLLRRLVNEMEGRVAGLGGSEVSSTPYEIVIVASMIEAEARVPGDRGKIAAVIHNRLERGMPLGIDATVAYAVGKRGGELTQEDLDVDSPYNTRVYAGLPPTPIGAPGMASLEAAARPASGDWLYFVLTDCAGHHSFSESYEDFLEDKAAYQALEC